MSAMPDQNPYVAPVREIEYALYRVAGFDEVAGVEGCEGVDPDLVRAILEEAGRFAANVLAPINRSGDRQGARVTEQGVATADGWREAYRQFVAAGWSAMVFPSEVGGQGLPWTLATAVDEMWQSANMAFALNPMLTRAAASAIYHHGNDEQKARFLPRLVSGEWAGTMNLTEPQAGSDLGAIRCRAVSDGDRYLLSGQKIFITYGDHDLTDNIIHMVLARLPDAPPGVKGLSFFIVPKYKLRPDGSPGEPNDLRCLSLEDKLGIHASPTCVMAYGEKGGAEGYLLGERDRGIEYMFTMMNESRLAVGVEGIGIAERAFQQARLYAHERIQGRPFGQTEGGPVAIVHHADVRRMLMAMKSRIEAMRYLALRTAAWLDLAQRLSSAQARKRAAALAALMTPVVKGWCTECSVEITSMAIQVHGGNGYIEEIGACQHFRDARITTIYEGTTAIQANDLVGRKLIRNGGETMNNLLEMMDASRRELQAAGFESEAERFEEAINALKLATLWLLAKRHHSELVAAAAVNYLHLVGEVAGGWMMARSAVAASRPDVVADDFQRVRLACARFYMAHVLPEVSYLASVVTQGSEAVNLLDCNLV